MTINIIKITDNKGKVNNYTLNKFIKKLNKDELNLNNSFVELVKVKLQIK